MLAQNFKTATDLAITDAEFNVLVKVLGMLERDEIPSELFCMTRIGSPELGTPGCICGWARSIDDTVFLDRSASGGGWRNAGLTSLFLAYRPISWAAALTPAQAAFALRSFLTCGDPHWEEVPSVE